jgi:hypothetical protein
VPSIGPNLLEGKKFSSPFDHSDGGCELSRISKLISFEVGYFMIPKINHIFFLVLGTVCEERSFQRKLSN